MASTTEELFAEILAEAMEAMEDAEESIKDVMDKEVESFYSQGDPKLYTRTGTLGSSPRTSGVTASGATLSFEAYLDQSLTYLVPNPAFTSRGLASYFSTLQIYTAAEEGLFGVLGRPGFWARSESQMQEKLDEAMSKHFS